MKRGHGIGIDRRLDIEWLDAVAGKAASKSTERETRAFLFDLLGDSLAGGCRRGSACHKTVGVLMGTWVVVPKDLLPLRDRCLAILPDVDHRLRLALHWTMLLARYPFFLSTVSIVGRMLKLQETVTMSQVERRVQESWGDRSTVRRAAQRIVRSVIQWGVLLDRGRPGLYGPSEKIRVGNAEVGSLLLEGILSHDSTAAIALDQSWRHPGLFPFDFAFSPAQLRNAKYLRVERLGLDTDVVRLRD